MTFSTFCFWLLLGIGLTWLARSITISVERVKTQTREELIEQLTQKIHRVKEEKAHDVYYWFDNDSDQFLAQGGTFDDLVAVLKSRFPQHYFLLRRDEQDLIICSKTKWQPQILTSPDLFTAKS